MNVAEIQKQVEDELEWAPDVAAHDVDIRRVIDRAYRAICASGDWQFLRRRAPLWVLPDVPLTPDVDFVQTIVGGANSNRIFSIANADQFFAGLLYPTEDRGVGWEFGHMLVHAELELVDMSKRNAPAVAPGIVTPWAHAPFAVEQVQWAPFTTTCVFALDPRAIFPSAGMPAAAASGDARFVWRRYQLPPDCNRLLAIIDDEGRPLTPADWREARRAGVTEQTGSRPIYYLQDDGIRARFAPNADMLFGTTPMTKTPWHRATENPPPSFTLTAAPLNAGGTLPDARYRLFVTWEYGGRFSAPSNIVEVTVAGADDTIRLGFAGLVSNDYGRRLVVWVSKDDSAFYANTAVTAPSAVTVDIETWDPDLTGEPWAEIVRWDEAYPGRYQYVQVWPRPAEALQFHVEYLARPKSLIEDRDAPEWDEDLHHALVWLALEQLASRHRDGPLWQRIRVMLHDPTEGLLPRLRARHLQRDQASRQKALGDGTGPAATRRPIDYRGP